MTQVLDRLSAPKVKEIPWDSNRHSKKTWSRGIPWVEHGRVKESRILVRKTRKSIRRG